MEGSREKGEDISIENKKNSIKKSKKKVKIKERLK